ncbi:MAG: hypothetical protein RL641_478 [Candidatus Parcubacteria bacterium]|jgi:mRNA interferase MazF
MIKRFFEWVSLKQKLHEKAQTPPYFKEAEVWWCSLGENVGYEVNGKSKLFSRPVIILKKLSHYVFIGIPLSTKTRDGTWYVSITHRDQNVTANISQLRLLDFRRLSSKNGELDRADFDKIKKRLKALLNL